MKPQVYIEECKGKTIKDLTVRDAYLLITFTDDTFSYVSSCGDDGSVIEARETLTLDFPDHDELIWLGITTAEEIQAHDYQRKEAWQREYEANLRRQFESIKKKIDELDAAATKGGYR